MPLFALCALLSWKPMMSAQACTGCSATGSCPAHFACFDDCTCHQASPIIVDTLGKGFQLTTAESGVLFDIAGSGHPIQMAWTAANSGNAFLALDRNGNGKIDNGKELFGNFTDQPLCPDGDDACRNGYRALAEFDKPEKGGNGDGIIDQRDAIYAHLLVWIDENHDGISQPSELHTLPELGVFSLALKYKKSSRTDEFGNQFRYKAAVNPDPKDGESKDGRWAFDVFFMTEGDSNRGLPPLQEGLNPGPKPPQAQCVFCSLPTSELSYPQGVFPDSPVVQFNQTLSDTSGDSFDGHAVQEVSGGQGTDTCWWADNSRNIPQYPVISGGDWTVAGGEVAGQHNHWGYDNVGIDVPSLPAYIRTYGPAKGVHPPCTLTIYQEMVFYCDSDTNYLYVQDTLTTTVNVSTTVRNCRASNCKTVNGY
jgi:hypothetical protein